MCFHVQGSKWFSLPLQILGISLIIWLAIAPPAFELLEESIPVKRRKSNSKSLAKLSIPIHPFYLRSNYEYLEEVNDILRIVCCSLPQYTHTSSEERNDYRIKLFRESSNGETHEESPASRDASIVAVFLLWGWWGVVTRSFFRGYDTLLIPN